MPVHQARPTRLADIKLLEYSASGAAYGLLIHRLHGGAGEPASEECSNQMVIPCPSYETFQNW